MAHKFKFPPLKNDRLLRAARGEEVDKIPVWIMRQTGKYLPEYRQLFDEQDYYIISEVPSKVSEVTLQPIRRFDDLDAAIIFSDILVIVEALGMELEIKPDIGIVLPNPLLQPDDIKMLEYPVDIKAALGYLFDAISVTRLELEGKVPLIGFSGAPWTLMCYMIEGDRSKTMSKAKYWLYKYPTESEQLLKILTETVTDFLIEQGKAGAQFLQIFEYNAEYLDPECFSKFALPSIASICKNVKEKLKQENLDIPLAIYAKGAHYALEELAKTGYDIIGIDWTVDPILARQAVGPNITLQGNLDPCALYAKDSDLIELTNAMVNKFGKSRYIANLGHGIYPDVEPERVRTLLNFFKANLDWLVRKIRNTVNKKLANDGYKRHELFRDFA
ncbi:hypothetical protein O3M35_003026 [Rhynocoris fuscipes]|uniref:Uroporphyrinogen decarboxylase n=1 Tax=Rhynocoris fuscipes TaxID=488301 RepID=A0AAW1CJY2_9HEMI